MAKIGQSMQPANLNEAMTLASHIANSKIVPEGYRGKPDDILVSIMLGTEIGLSAIQSLQNIAVINGRPSIYGDAMLALVQNHASFQSIKETFDDSTMTATCIVQRKGAEPHTVTFSREDAEKAKLWSKGGVWSNYPKRMLQMRARGFALRDQFSDALLGLISREEAEDIRDLKDITNDSTIINDEPTKPTKAAEIESVILPAYTNEQFEKNFPSFEALIKAGRKTAKDIIYMVHGKFTLNDEQINKINSVVKNG